jgi:hypothetical protein
MCLFFCSHRMIDGPMADFILAFPPRTKSSRPKMILSSQTKLKPLFWSSVSIKHRSYLVTLTTKAVLIVLRFPNASLFFLPYSLCYIASRHTSSNPQVQRFQQVKECHSMTRAFHRRYKSTGRISSFSPSVDTEDSF